MIKTLSLSCLLVFATLYNFAQKNEVSVVANSGLFSFNGKSAGTHSWINYHDFMKSSYTNNPYGSLSGLCYGGGISLNRVTRVNIVFGIETAYEVLRSKISIDAVTGSPLSSLAYSARGHTNLNYQFINLFPHVGYRVKMKALNVALSAGFDLAFCLAAREKGAATTTDGIKYETSLDRKTISDEIRPRMQINLSRQQLGVYAGYSLGLANYKGGYVGGINECYARLFRFGLTWRLR